MGNSPQVYIYNRTRESFVATKAVVANSYVARLVGLLGVSIGGLLIYFGALAL